MFDDVEGGFSDYLNPPDILGHLLLVWAVDYIPHSPTKYSTPGKLSDVILVDGVDLDRPDENGHQGLLVRRAWWRQSRLIRDLKNKIGRPNPMLFRLGKDTSQPGPNAPYIIISMKSDPESVKRAEAWLAAHPDFRPSEKLEYDNPPDTPAQPTYHQPPAVQYQQPQQQYTPPPPAPPLPPPPPPRVTGEQPTVLERLAQQAASGRSRFENQHEEPPF
jgi:hypothetical protein